MMKLLATQRSIWLVLCCWAGFGLYASAESFIDQVAQGGAVYARPGSCIACHQAHGEGIPGAIPPLAGSEWVQGDLEALIRIVEHGIEGEITVKGDTYQAVMPAQGNLMSDTEFANLLTFLRYSWGNKVTKDGKVQANQIAEQRKRDQARGDKPWSVAELRQALVAESLREPTVAVYPGTWNEIPVLTNLPAGGTTGPGLLSSKLAPAAGGLLVVEGTVTTVKPGQAAITLRANGPTQAWIDGVLVVSTPSLITGEQRPRVDRIDSVELKPGTHRIRVAHLATAGVKMACAAAVQLPGFNKPVALNDNAAEQIDRGQAGLELQPSVTKTPMIYRGVFGSAGARTIAVGYPERLSVLFDTMNATWRMAWRGAFVSGQHHWSGRGMGFREWPLGEQIAILPAEPAFAVMATPGSPWPVACDVDVWPAGYQFFGYALDRALRPSFRYQVDTVQITDTPEPQADGTTIRRRLQVRAPTAVANLFVRPIAGKNLLAVSPTVYRFDQRLTISLTAPGGAVPVVRPCTAGTEVLLPVVFSADGSAEIIIDYHWEDHQ